MSDFTAAGILTDLVKFASVISGSHATAVANYALEYADKEIGDRELNEVLIRILSSLAAEIATAVDSAESFGGVMTMVPVIPTDPMHADLVHYRNDCDELFRDLVMIDGLFVVRPKGRDPFWP